MAQDLTKQHIGRLREAIEQNKCMLMVSHGLSAQVHPVGMFDFPLNWSDVLIRMTDWCRTKKLIDDDRKIAIDDLIEQKDHATAQKKINSLLNSSLLREECLSHVLLHSKADICEAHRIIVRLPFRAYITTNYDRFIEDAFKEQEQPIETLYDTQIEEALEYRENGQQFVLKLCGDICCPYLINLVDVDLEKRFKTSTHPSVKGKILKNLLSRYHLLCIGLQPGNPDLARLENLCKEGVFHKSVDYWIAVPVEHKIDFARVSEQSQNIHIIPYSPDEGLEGFLKQLESPSSRQNTRKEKNKQEEGKQSVLETVANGEHYQNNTIQSPAHRNLQEYESYSTVLSDKDKADSISYVDFTLRIGSDGTIWSSSNEGQRTASIALAVPEDIQLRSRLIKAGDTDEELLIKLGIKLYQMIFPPDIDKHFNQTEAAARGQGRRVRIRLEIEPDTLAVLPWEFLYRKEGGYFLAVNPDTVLARYLDLPLPPDLPSKQAGPLHLLIIIANPTDQTSLDPDEWEGIISKALKKPIQDGLITTRTVKQATFEQIRDALLQHKPNIIQFVGHGIYRDGKGYLALVDSKTDKTWEVDESRFAGIFLEVRDTLRLLTLATCESAKSDSPRGFLGIAPQIVRRGVPIVVAMQYSIPIDIAEIYLEDFYTVIAAHRPVDWAVQHARNTISIKKGLDNREFATPVLYMRATDGDLF